MSKADRQSLVLNNLNNLLLAAPRTVSAVFSSYWQLLSPLPEDLHVYTRFDEKTNTEFLGPLGIINGLLELFGEPILCMHTSGDEIICFRPYAAGDGSSNYDFMSLPERVRKLIHCFDALRVWSLEECQRAAIELGFMDDAEFGQHKGYSLEVWQDSLKSYVRRELINNFCGNGPSSPVEDELSPQ